MNEDIKKKIEREREIEKQDILKDRMRKRERRERWRGKTFLKKCEERMRKREIGNMNERKRQKH